MVNRQLLIKSSPNLVKTLSPILSPKEIQTILKRLKNKPITQTESNYLSRSIRPKLQAAEQATQLNILSKLDYKRKKYQRNDQELKKQILNAIPKNIQKQIKAIILYGSYLTTNHTNYKDIDLLIILKKKLWSNLKEKSKLKQKIESNTQPPLDITITTEKSLKEHMPYNPILQSQMQTHKIIHGNITLPKTKKRNKPYLYQLAAEIEAIKGMNKIMTARELYHAIRTSIAIIIYLKGNVNNDKIERNMKNILGKEVIKGLRQGKLTKLQRKITIIYLKQLYQRLENTLLYPQNSQEMKSNE